METVSEVIAGLRRMPLHSIGGVLASLVVLVLALLLFRIGNDDGKQPYRLPDWKGIPVLGNTVQMVLDDASFVSRARCVVPRPSSPCFPLWRDGRS